MSSFYCEKCGEAIIDTPRGYITGCKHYPLEEKSVLSPNMKGRVKHMELEKILAFADSEIKEWTKFRKSLLSKKGRKKSKK